MAKLGLFSILKLWPCFDGVLCVSVFGILVGIVFGLCLDVLNFACIP